MISDSIGFFIAAITFIPLHEVVHYVVAKSFDLNPEFVGPGPGRIAGVRWDYTARSGINSAIMHAPLVVFILLSIGMMLMKYPFTAFGGPLIAVVTLEKSEMAMMITR